MHDRHSLRRVAPDDALYVPIGQLVHVAPFLYCPGGHAARLTTTNPSPELYPLEKFAGCAPMSATIHVVYCVATLLAPLMS